MVFWGTLGGLSLLFALVFSNLKRARTPAIPELKPNILLTRFPLIFVTGHRSLFYFLGYFEQIPNLLASHGFEVFHLTLPWQSHQRRLHHLHKFLLLRSSQGQRFHFFIDSSTQPELAALLAKENFSCISSVTHLQNGQACETTSNALSALSRPIEELSLPTSPRRSWQWTAHRLLHPHLWRLSRFNSGFIESPALNNLVLERSQFLAERDLIQG
jgi:hypothetical protein